MRIFKFISFIFLLSLFSNCGPDIIDLRSENKKDFDSLYQLKLSVSQETNSFLEDEADSFVFEVFDHDKKQVSLQSFAMQAKMKCCGRLVQPKKTLLLGDSKKACQVSGLKLSKGQWLLQIDLKINGRDYFITHEYEVDENV